MLVLTRKRAEVIRIGDNVIVKVIRTGKSTVKIGIEAPAHVPVLRGELTPHPKPAIPKTPGETPLAETVLHCSDQFPHVV
jgi:carbon storage regulator CsrA